MNNSKKFIQNSSFATASIHVEKGHTPKQYGGLQHQYMGARGDLFIQERAQYSSDFVAAKIQGLSSCFYDYTDVNIRLSNVSNKLRTNGKSDDDIKEILIADGGVKYIPPGAKLIAMGSTWIVTNTANIAAVNGKAIVERCNASYNSYDKYGNVVTEPIIVESKRMPGNKNTTPENIVIMDGYFEVKCQLNEITRELGINKRIVLGSLPYSITGFADFFQEFTGDRESVHIATFTARVDEPTELDDVAVNFVANGNAHTFEAEIIPEIDALTIGEEAALQAVFLRDDEIVNNTEQTPVFWQWTSDNTAVAKVVGGKVTALAEGSATIRATLAQNKDVYASVSISVVQATTEPHIEFKGLVPNAIQQYDASVINAVYYEGEEELPASIEWIFSGADESTYFAETSDDGEYCTIQCLKPSDTPLIVTASCNGVSKTAEIGLEGY